MSIGEVFQVIGLYFGIMFLVFLAWMAYEIYRAPTWDYYPEDEIEAQQAKKKERTSKDGMGGHSAF